MASGIKNVVYPVEDLARAKAIFGTLLGEPYVDQPYYVGYRVDDQEIGLDPHGHKDGAVGYWEVEDIKQTLQELVDAGAVIQQEPRDVGGGMLVAVVRDGANLIGVRQAG